MQVVIASSFPDVATAQAAADELVRSGFPAEHVHLHEKGTPPRNATGIRIDEYATGGMFSGVLSLLDGIFKAPKQPDEASTYVDVVRQEGVGLSVVVAADEEAQHVEAALRSAGAMKVARQAAGA
jgi:hypothetical protein